MRKKFKEKQKLPLTFKYIELFKSKNIVKLNSNITYYLQSEKYDTSFLSREKPLKHFTRML